MDVLWNADPRLIADVDRSSPAGAIGVRFYAANTVDAPDPAHAAHYPPPSAVLASATLGVAPYQRPLTALDRTCAMPLVLNTDVYVLGRAAAGPPALLGFALRATADAAATAVPAELQRLLLVSRPVVVQCMWSTMETPAAPIAGQAVGIIFMDGTPGFSVTTDAGGRVVLDAAYAGHTAYFGWNGRESSTCVLSTQTVNVMQAEPDEG